MIYSTDLSVVCLARGVVVVVVVEGAACHGASAAVFFFPCLPCLFCFLTSFFSEPLYLGTLPYLNPERTYFCLLPVFLVCTV